MNFPLYRILESVKYCLDSMTESRSVVAWGEGGRVENTLGHTDLNKIKKPLDCGFHRYIHMSKLIKLCTLNISSLLYGNYTSVNMFKIIFLNFENGKVMVKECRERPGDAG